VIFTLEMLNPFLPLDTGGKKCSRAGTGRSKAARQGLFCQPM
jgi:hypothetical protein